MVQLLVVLIISAILLAIVGSAVSSARQSGQRRTAIETARTMADAVDRFRLDHGERPPAIGDLQDWPTANRGPQNYLTKKRYMKTDSDALSSSSWLKLGTSVTNPQHWSLVYRATTQAPHGFRIDVIYHNSAAPPSCTISIDRAPASTVGTLGAC